VKFAGVNALITTLAGVQFEDTPASIRYDIKKSFIRIDDWP
jgi:hypothetical protein